MKTIVEICAHKVCFDYFTKSKRAVPSESEMERVQTLISDNFRAGELLMYLPGDNGQDYEYDGWWRIMPEDHSTWEKYYKNAKTLESGK